jgi:hypothetical protein
MAGSLLEREDREKRPPSDLLGLAPHWLNAPCILLFARPKEGLLVPWFLAPWSVRRKKPSPPGLPLRVVACSPPFLNARARITPRLYANGYPGSSRHPIVRQLVYVVNTSIWKVVLAHIDFRDSGWHSSSEYAGACAVETHKTSTSALHPLSGCAQLPR